MTDADDALMGEHDACGCDDGCECGGDGDCEHDEESRLGEIDAVVEDGFERLIRSGLFAGSEVMKDVVTAEEDLEALADEVALAERAEKVYQEIIARAPEHKVQPSLDRVKSVLDYLGNPEKAYETIQITGTNGKTSTARMIEALLREKGLRTGRFTSPHLVNVRERICINGHALTNQEFLDVYDEVAPVVELVDQMSLAQGGPRMSFFEVLTVMAYAAFATAPVDVAVMEVGMGGRWDATNVVNSTVGVLTNVALDHQKWLGATTRDIATEKLGILNPGATLVVGQCDPEIDELVMTTAAQVGVPVRKEGRDLEVLGTEAAVGGQLVTLRTPAAVYEDVPLAMLGLHQARNAALALTAVEAFFGGAALDGRVVETAWMSLSSPGRLEVLRSSPRIIADGAHNPAGAEALAAALPEYVQGSVVAIFSAMADKDVDAVLGELEPVVEHLVVMELAGNPRAMALEELEAVAVDVFGRDRVHTADTLLDAIDTAAGLAEAHSEDPMVAPAVLITGSLYLVGQARQLLMPKHPDL